MMGTIPPKINVAGWKDIGMGKNKGNNIGREIIMEPRKIRGSNTVE
jgi:hypothetical protein